MNKTLKEGKDFNYNEKGLMVFTASYLMDRGYCCNNKCTHCPYSNTENTDPNHSHLPDNHK